ncbi:bifunctional 3-(3-hydroxy-phenyl)propionate/3-hydroxycinnamic acid hydroxylase [Antrihabitans stalactiti]|uniref:Bifunctional 3-(3-hydroxy-phenyl)propionate/3-hydroxycinnamic acid hydroxylase n=1 Tax=Antrihabitans stalactiti TaxID=2584121 RepID=A0A848KMQ4_9NOCA|nr:bifunctional 3-(3-hydroxy-phenyl)propionate/3-hydroxycinnamic acid hydroxylase [Antrihabitans stalactiti]NMN99509.1 bifunctional 3-(3-hydroxy-phenyl)propionate/3-hydroxycinnamic acid hydroxylase [Antrihabitans stalactiti]
MNTHYDVAIIGYGPTGLVLASALGQAGHRVIVIEKWPGLYGLPRLTHIDGEVARVIQSVADVDHALRDGRPIDSYRYVNGAGEVLVDLDFSGESAGFPAHIAMYQPDIEDAIDARVRSFPNVEVNQGNVVVAFEQHPDSVSVTFRPWAASRTEQWSNQSDARTVTARFLVGADGANSFVRTALGIDRADLGVDDRWLNIDTERLRPLGAKFDRLIQVCDPARGHMFMPIGKTRQRFELALLPGEDASEFERPEFGWQWLREQHGIGPDDVRMLRQVVYVFQARVAQEWRRGRVLLAGDAAHTMPPYMGQGACSGMRDAITLAWKLDLVLRGRADEKLLDTYEAERRPHATAIVENSVALGRIANTHDHDAAAARDEAFRTGTVPPPPPFPTLVGGVVHCGPDGSATGLAGTLAPQGEVEFAGVRGRFDDVVGRGFAVIASGDPRAVLDSAQLDFLTGLDAVVIALADIRDAAGVYRKYLADNDIDVFIARPDFHLFGAGRMADLPALIDALQNRLAWKTTREQVAV